MKQKLMFILPVILIVLITLVNIIGIAVKNNKEKDNDDNLPYKIEENIKETIYLEGIKEDVLYNRITTKIFKFCYDPEYLNFIENDEYYLFESKTNKEIYIKIEEVSKEDYNQQTNFVSRNDMLIQYYYRTNGEKYYQITTSIPNDVEYIEGIGSRFIYMIDTFKLI